MKRKRKPKQKPVNMILGDNLSSWREENGFPLKTVATDLGVSISVCSQWERGLRFPSCRNLDHIADHLGITVADLVTQK